MPQCLECEILKEAVRLLQEKLRAAEEIARIDPLTGLYNRRMFDERLSSLVRRARRSNQKEGPKLLCISLNQLKQVNDQLGHESGDVLLKLLASFLRDTFRRASDECFKLGGGKFAVLAESMLPAAYRLSTNFVEYQLSNSPLPLGATLAVGLSSVTREVAQLVSGADTNMCQCKTWMKSTGMDALVPILAKTG